MTNETISQVPGEKPLLPRSVFLPTLNLCSNNSHHTSNRSAPPLLPLALPRNNMAFVTCTPVLARSTARAATSRAPRMSLARRAAAVRAAALPAVLAAAPALAEGTGEGLGIDNGLLYLPFILVPGVFLFLFLQFDRSQNKDDFFGNTDDRRN